MYYVRVSISEIGQLKLILFVFDILDQSAVSLYESVLFSHFESIYGAGVLTFGDNLKIYIYKLVISIIKKRLDSSNTVRNMLV